MITRQTTAQARPTNARRAAGLAHAPPIRLARVLARGSPPCSSIALAGPRHWLATLVRVSGGEEPAGGAQTRAVRWVFLDRDGTLNAGPPAGQYITNPKALSLLPGAGEAVRMLNQAGVWTGLVTNQRGVALGRMTIAQLAAVHSRLVQLLSDQQARLDAIYYCPHEVGVCGCRKPQSGMFLRARREQPDIDFKRAAIVGDSLNDIEAGRRLGLSTVLLCPPGRTDPAIHLADHVVPDLLQAARLLLRAPAGRQRRQPDGLARTAATTRPTPPGAGRS